MLQVAGCNKALNGTQFGRLDKRGTICPLILTHHQNMDLYFHGTCFAEYTLQPNKLLFVFGIFTHFCREPGESQSLEGRIVLMWCQHRSETKKMVKRFKDKLQSRIFSNLYMKTSWKVDIPIQTFLPLFHFHCATIWSGFQSFQVCPTF